MSEHIDKIFRDKLGKHQAPVPTDLWETIAADQASKRRAAHWRAAAKYVTLLVLLFGGLLIGYALTNGEEATIDAEPVVNSPASASSDETTTATPELVVTTPAATAAVTAQNTPFDTNDGASIQPNKVTASSNQTTLPKPEVHEVTSDEITPAVLNDESAATPTTDFSELDQPQVQQLAAIATMPTLPLPLLAPYRVEISSRKTITANQPATGGVFSKRQRNKFTFDLLAGPAYANQTFSIANESDRSLLNAREISEFPSVSMLAGFRVAYQLKGRWSLRSGLLFTQIRNQFEFEQISEDPLEAPLLIRSSNRIRLLEIPLLATYELPGKRFRLAINAGPVLNVSTSAKGRHLLPDLQQPINLEEENIYRNRIGISYQLSLTAAYQLGQGNSLLIEPTFRSYSSSFTQDTYALGERYWLAGIQFGLRHRLR